MRSKLLLLSLCCGSLTWATEPADPVLMSVNGKDVRKSEFEYIYNKNNQQQVDNKSLSEYLTLFRNFKLKVAEAEAQGIDTTQAFRSELAGYRKQLAEPYLVDRKVDEQVAHEAYDRLKENVEVSHILFRVAPDATPADTMRVYQKALSVLDRIRKGEDFGKLAKEYSEDPSVQQNNGYLGFITGFMTVYPFENAAYQTPVGEVSEPVRSQFGYHLVKVSSRRPDPGQVLVAHIIRAVPRGDTEEANARKQQIEKEVREMYEQLIQGADFAEMAKEKSDDPGSARKGGELPWFGSGRMIKEFETVAFALKEKGDISEPVLSPFGWHIIKLIDRKSLESYEEKKPEIMRRIARDERGNKGKNSLIEKLKKEYGFTLNEPVVAALKGIKDAGFPADSSYQARIADNQEVLFSFASQSIPVADFARYLDKNKYAGGPKTPDAYLDERINQFAGKKILEYEETQLENKYPEFRNLMNEYRDGILLFEVSNREVWDKASKDTEGLERFFKKNKKKYAWKQPHYKGFVIHCKDSLVADSVRTDIPSIAVDSMIYLLQKKYNNDSVKLVRVEKGIYVEGDNNWVDHYIFSKDIPAADEKFPVVFISGKILKKGPESYLDVRGLVTADYQTELEKRWIKALNKKYRVEIDKDVVKTVNSES